MDYQEMNLNGLRFMILQSLIALKDRFKPHKKIRLGFIRFMLQPKILTAFQPPRLQSCLSNFHL